MKEIETITNVKDIQYVMCRINTVDSYDEDTYKVNKITEWALVALPKHKTCFICRKFVKKGEKGVLNIFTENNELYLAHEDCFIMLTMKPQFKG